MHDMRVRQNYWAILTAGIFSFLLAAGWYTVFMEAWLRGISRTMDWFKTSGVPTWISPVGAFVLALLMATAISCVVQMTGVQTAARGIKVGFLLWLGFVCTCLGTEYIYELRPGMFALNAGFWLIAMPIMGAIVGGWKKKAAVGSAASEHRAQTVAQ